MARTVWQNVVLSLWNSNVSHWLGTDIDDNIQHSLCTNALVTEVPFMECNDDIAGNISTTTTLTLGEAFSSTLTHSGCESDVDFLRVELEFGRRYRLGIRRLPDARILNANGFPQSKSFDPGFSPVSHSFRAIADGTHYFAISGFGSYFIEPEEIDSEDNVPEDIFQLGYAALDKLTDDVRRVPFQLSTVPGRDYVISVFGSDDGGIGTLADPAVGYADFDGTRLFDDNSGDGLNPSLRFTAESSGGYVSVTGEGSGSFQLNIRQVDTVAVGQQTSIRLKPHVEVNEYVESPSDIDWFRVSLEAGQNYEIDWFDNNFNLMLRNPDGEIVRIWRPVDAVSQTIDYLAEASGDHFLIARMGQITRTGRYRLGIEPVAAPITELQQEASAAPDVRRFVVEGGEEISLADFLRDDRSAESAVLTEYEVYATRGLFRGEVQQNARTIYQVPESEIGLWTQRLAGDNETTDLMIRAKIGGVWTQWDRNPIFHRSSNQDLINGPKWELDENRTTITWDVPDSIPDYFSDTYSGFKDIGRTFGLVGQATNNAQGLASRVLDDADINIFVADGVEGYVDAFAPGPDGGGDIVLNSEFYGGDIAPVPGSIEYLEILRGFATALGLSEVSDADQTRTVLADFSTAPNGLPYTFLSHDERALESLYGVDIRPSISLGDLQNFITPGIALRVQRTSFDALTIETIDRREHGEVIFRTQDGGSVLGFRGAETESGLFTTTSENAEGANSFGDSQDNLISDGNAGWVDGRAGDDRLFGSTGANWYGYQFGHGDDVISERDSSGPRVNPRDTLRMIGFSEFNISLDRLQFTRLDHDFDILGPSLAPIDLRIDVLNEQGNSEGSVTIDGQGRDVRRIEILEIYHGSEQTHRISLPSLYGQLAINEPTRFELVPANTALGSLVAPI